MRGLAEQGKSLAFLGIKYLRVVRMYMQDVEREARKVGNVQGRWWEKNKAWCFVSL